MTCLKERIVPILSKVKPGQIRSSNASRLNQLWYGLLSFILKDKEEPHFGSTYFVQFEGRIQKCERLTNGYRSTIYVNHRTNTVYAVCTKSDFTKVILSCLSHPNLPKLELIEVRPLHLVFKMPKYYPFKWEEYDKLKPTEEVQNLFSELSVIVGAECDKHNVFSQSDHLPCNVMKDGDGNLIFTDAWHISSCYKQEEELKKIYGDKYQTLSHS